MKRRKKLPYVIIILACIFLLIPFAATLVYSFTIGWKDGLLNTGYRRLPSQHYGPLSFEAF